MKGTYWLLSGVLSLSMALSGTLTVLAEGADAGLFTETSALEQEAASREMTVEYGNLRTLLKEGNLTLKKTIEDQEDSVNAYQEMWDTMKWEQDNLEDKAEEMEDDADSKGMETAALYASNASMLKSSAKRIYNQIKNLTDEKSTRSIEKSADSYTYTAQTLMNSYNQMASNVKATEKSVNVLEASYQSLVRKGQAGTATQAEVQEGQNRLEQARTSLSSLKEQEKQLRYLSCLTCWGWRTVDRYPSEPYPSRIWPPSGPLTLRAIRIRPLAMTQMFRTSATQKPSAQRKSTRGSGRWTRQREPQKPPLPLPTRNSRHSFYSTRQRSNPTQVRNWSTSP